MIDYWSQNRQIKSDKINISPLSFIIKLSIEYCFCKFCKIYAISPFRFG